VLTAGDGSLDLIGTDPATSSKISPDPPLGAPVRFPAITSTVLPVTSSRPYTPRMRSRDGLSQAHLTYPVGRDTILLTRCIPSSLGGFSPNSSRVVYEKICTDEQSKPLVSKVESMAAALPSASSNDGSPGATARPAMFVFPENTTSVTRADSSSVADTTVGAGTTVGLPLLCAVA